MVGKYLSAIDHVLEEILILLKSNSEACILLVQQVDV